MKIKVFRFNSKIIIALAVVLVLICIILLFSLLFKPASLPVFQAERKIPIYSVEKNEKVISITFDCAWGADDIPQILETLRDRNIKASFFVLGQWAEKYPDKIKLIAEDGHDLANHSYSHLRMGSISESKIREEIISCEKVLKDLSIEKVDLFRPPYGDYNNKVIEIADELGYYTIQWDVDSLDWKPDIGREEIKNRIYSKVGPGSILLFHNDTKHTADLLPELLDGLKGMGYNFLPVSEFIMRDNYLIDVQGRQKSK